jgi:hypothetical protein
MPRSLEFHAAQMTRTTHAARPHAGPCRPNIISVEKRRHRDETAEDEEGDVIPDLLLKYLNETFATYVQNS